MNIAYPSSHSNGFVPDESNTKNCILSVFSMATFGFQHCLNPSRHTLNQVLTHFSRYIIPLASTLSHNSNIPPGGVSYSPNLLLMCSQRCSIGLRSGDCAGHCRRVNL